MGLRSPLVLNYNTTFTAMLRPAARQGILFISLVAILFTGASGSKSFAQTLADTSQDQEPTSSQQNEPRDQGVDGIGYLTISHLYLERIAGTNMSQYEASKTIKIVFFDRPQGREIAKIEQGVLSKGDQIINKNFQSPLLTYYSQSSFTVLEKRSGGWYRIRYMVGNGSDGIGWVQVKTKKQDPFVYRSWQEYFLSSDVILAEFNNKKGNNLYDRPSTSGKRLKDIGGSIQIQEFRGDWMRVKFREKVFHCDAEPKPKTARVRTGWVKWRNQGRLLIGAPAKGC
jgi:hypothetical protein